MRNVTRVRRSVVIALLLVAGAGCGGGDDDDVDNTLADDVPTESSLADDTAADASLADGSVDDESALTALSAQEICDGLTAESVGGSLGLEVTGAEAGGSSTAQCAYTYESPSGGQSNVTVASLAPDVDLGGRSGNEAFEYVLEINRGLAAGTEFEEADVDAGDRAVRLSGEALHLGIVAAGGHLFTVIVPGNDVDGAMVDALLDTVDQTLGG